MEGSVEREIEYWKAYYQRQRTRLFASRSALLILGALVVPWLREGRDVSELAQALSETGVTAKGALDLATVIRSFTSNAPEDVLPRAIVVVPANERCEFTEC